jgi:hypothetical protein
MQHNRSECSAVSRCAVAFLLALMVSAPAVAAAGKVDNDDKPAPRGERRIVLVISEDGSVEVEAAPGALSDTKCSLDARSAERCPMFNDSRIQMKSIESILIMQYQVNPLCYLVGSGSFARLICYP